MYLELHSGILPQIGPEEYLPTWYVRLEEVSLSHTYVVSWMPEW
jgi:hypothetical protein